jgi:hypothetical protein
MASRGPPWLRAVSMGVRPGFASPSSRAAGSHEEAVSHMPGSGGSRLAVAASGLAWAEWLSVTAEGLSRAGGRFWEGPRIASGGRLSGVGPGIAVTSYSADEAPIENSIE